ncbi:ribulose-phosphate 3-epimerase [Chloroflexota bacterium]
MIVFEPSILSADLANLGDQVRQVQAAGGTIVQVDVMDGQFVPNLTFGPLVLRAIRPLVDLKLDAHLMIVEPERFIDEFARAGADRIFVHQETCPNLKDTLRYIRSLGVESGVTLNPETPLSTIEDVLEEADLVQVMTVHPGFGGQKFLEDQLPKIRQLRSLLADHSLEIPIAVDGGIDEHTAPLAVKAGATILIAGSSVFNKQATIADNLAALYASVAR